MICTVNGQLRSDIFTLATYVCKSKFDMCFALDIFALMISVRHRELCSWGRIRYVDTEVSTRRVDWGDSPSVARRDMLTQRCQREKKKKFTLVVNFNLNYSSFLIPHSSDKVGFHFLVDAPRQRESIKGAPQRCVPFMCMYLTEGKDFP